MRNRLRSRQRRSAVALTGGDDFTGFLRNRGVKSRLRDIDNLSKTGKYLAALGGVHILYKSVQGRSNVKISLLGGDFVLVHLGDCGSECGNYCRAIGKSRTGGNLGYAGNACVFAKRKASSSGTTFVLINSPASLPKAIFAVS